MWRRMVERRGCWEDCEDEELKIMWRRMVERRGYWEDCEEEEVEEKRMWRRRRVERMWRRRVERMWKRWRGEGRWWRGGW